jgi:hypothetical protein
MKRRLVEPTPAWKRCAWLNKWHGAKSIEQHWSAYRLWYGELWNALDLLELDCKHPCDCQPASRRSSHPGIRAGGGGAMTGSFDPREVNLSTAFHEAGHAWEYIYTHKLLRCMTVRPTQRMLGQCQAWEPTPLVSAAGPTTQARWMAEKHPASSIMFDSALAYTINNGGRIDWQRSTEVFANPHQVALLRSQITRDWAFIEALAAKLMVVGTITGAEVYALLLLRFMGVTS